ncbi:uncharacterized protein LOC135929537 isoform X3 [Gordionus sp. m RMFG-2023]|uniref:uncharacterized protein LOC135929537 isoform X3 n=1 Tax=Gordionus sp. m RMFG-2023 TaxID=3053472 RepID=UPI0031FC2C4F
MQLNDLLHIPDNKYIVKNYNTKKEENIVIETKYENTNIQSTDLLQNSDNKHVKESPNPLIQVQVPVLVKDSNTRKSGRSYKPSHLVKELLKDLYYSGTPPNKSSMATAYLSNITKFSDTSHNKDDKSIKVAGFDKNELSNNSPTAIGNQNMNVSSFMAEVLASTQLQNQTLYSSRKNSNKTPINVPPNNLLPPEETATSDHSNHEISQNKAPTGNYDIQNVIPFLDDQYYCPYNDQNIVCNFKVKRKCHLFRHIAHVHRDKIEYLDPDCDVKSYIQKASDGLFYCKMKECCFMSRSSFNVAAHLRTLHCRCGRNFEEKKDKKGNELIESTIDLQNLPNSNPQPNILKHDSLFPNKSKINHQAGNHTCDKRHYIKCTPRVKYVSRRRETVYPLARFPQLNQNNFNEPPLNPQFELNNVIINSKENSFDCQNFNENYKHRPIFGGLGETSPNDFDQSHENFDKITIGGNMDNERESLDDSIFCNLSALPLCEKDKLICAWKKENDINIRDETPVIYEVNAAIKNGYKDAPLNSYATALASTIVDIDIAEYKTSHETENMGKPQNFTILDISPNICATALVALIPSPTSKFAKTMNGYITRDRNAYKSDLPSNPSERSAIECCLNLMLESVCDSLSNNERALPQKDGLIRTEPLPIISEESPKSLDNHTNLHPYLLLEIPQDYDLDVHGYPLNQIYYYQKYDNHAKKSQRDPLEPTTFTTNYLNATDKNYPDDFLQTFHCFKCGMTLDLSPPSISNLSDGNAKNIERRTNQIRKQTANLLHPSTQFPTPDEFERRQRTPSKKASIVFCDLCCQSYHSYCFESYYHAFKGMSLPPENEIEKTSILNGYNICRNCQYCWVCFKNEPFKFVTCHTCYKSYHSQCLGPTITQPTATNKNTSQNITDIWECSICQNKDIKNSKAQNSRDIDTLKQDFTSNIDLVKDSPKLDHNYSAEQQMNGYNLFEYLKPRLSCNFTPDCIVNKCWLCNLTDRDFPPTDFISYPNMRNHDLNSLVPVSDYNLRTRWLHLGCIMTFDLLTFISTQAKYRGRKYLFYRSLLPNIYRVLTSICSLCRTAGASLVCQSMDCFVTFHLPCISKYINYNLHDKNTRISIYFRHGKFVVYCPKHTKVMPYQHNSNSPIFNVKDNTAPSLFDKTYPSKPGKLTDTPNIDVTVFADENVVQITKKFGKNRFKTDHIKPEMDGREVYFDSCQNSNIARSYQLPTRSSSKFVLRPRHLSSSPSLNGKFYYAGFTNDIINIPHQSEICHDNNNNTRVTYFSRVQNVSQNYSSERMHTKISHSECETEINGLLPVMSAKTSDGVMNESSLIESPRKISRLIIGCLHITNVGSSFSPPFHGMECQNINDFDSSLKGQILRELTQVDGEDHLLPHNITTYPDGFRSYRKFWSTSDPDKICTYKLEIINAAFLVNSETRGNSVYMTANRDGRGGGLDLNIDLSLVDSMAEDDLLCLDVNEIPVLDDRSRQLYLISNDEGLRRASFNLEGTWSEILTTIFNNKASKYPTLSPLPYGINCPAKLFGLRLPIVLHLFTQMDGYPFDSPQSKNDAKYILPKYGCSRLIPYQRILKLSLKNRELKFGIKSSSHKPVFPSFLPDEFGNSNSDLNNVYINNNIWSKKCNINSLKTLDRYMYMKATYRSRVYISRSRIHEKGLFASHDFRRGHIIIEYVGEIIRNIVADKREAQQNFVTNEAHRTPPSQTMPCYLFRLNKDYIIDANSSGNESRYINHSCQPNCYSKIVLCAGRRRILFYASAFIAKGCEITYDYKFPIEEIEEGQSEEGDNHNSRIINNLKIVCKCGSKACLGFLN